MWFQHIITRMWCYFHSPYMLYMRFLSYYHTYVILLAYIISTLHVAFNRLSHVCDYLSTHPIHTTCGLNKLSHVCEFNSASLLYTRMNPHSSCICSSAIVLLWQRNCALALSLLHNIYTHHILVTLSITHLDYI